MMFFYNSKEKLNKIIQIKKLGIQFRAITENEINKLVNLFKDDIANSGLMKMIDYYIKNIENDKVEFDDEKQVNNFKNFKNKLNSLDKDLRDCYWTLLNKKIEGKNFSKPRVRKLISKLNVIEVDEKIFSEIYSIDYAHYFLSRLTGLTFFLNSEELFPNKDNSTQFLLNENDISVSKSSVIGNLFLEENYMEINVDYKYLDKIANLLNNKDIYFNFHLLSIIDTLFSNTSLENDIINRVGIIERLIIKENSNIEKQFILKTGIILKKGKFQNISDISNILKTIYNVRSYLVHGNEKLLFEQLKEIGKQVGVTDLTKDKLQNKIEVIAAIKIFNDMFLKEVLLAYINENDFCEYLKNN